MYSVENSLWVERYRPKSVEDCILPKSIKNTFLGIKETGVIPNMLLSGSAGVGKTSVAKALCNDLDCEVLFINGSSERNIDLIRTKLTNFCSTVSVFDQQKVVIIDEADYLNAESTIPAMRAFIESFSQNARFIFTCNFPERFMDAIKSRFTNIDFTIPKDEQLDIIKQLYQRITGILKAEDVVFEKEAIGEIIKKYFPDFRRLLGELQSLTIETGGNITMDSVKDNITSVDEYIESLKAMNFAKASKWINENIGMIDQSRFYREMYNKMKTYLKDESLAPMILLLDEYTDKASRSIDPIITMAAFSIRCMSELEFK